MKRSIAVGTVAVLVLGGAVAGTGNAKPRRHKVTRSDSTGYVGGRGSAGGTPELYVDEGVFDTEAHERAVSLEIVDRSGQAVAATVRQDADEDGTYEVDEAFCGSTAKDVAITGGAPIVVKVQPGPCADGTPAVMTSGSIRATFTGYTRRAPVVPSLGCAPSAQQRETARAYQGPGGAGAATASYPVVLLETGATEAVGGAAFPTQCGEGSVEVALEDRTGLPARGVIAVDPDGQGPAAQELVAEICGSTDEPVAFPPAALVTVYVLAGPCADATPAAATTGTITVKFGAP